MNDDILIAYYSWSGNTKKIAEKIHEIIGGNIVEISPQLPYPDNYTLVVNQAKNEIKKGFNPEIKSTTDNIDIYNRIFIGSPNWWNTIAPPVATFLTKHNLAEKMIFPFCTHGGGGQGNIVNTIKRLCPNSVISDCLEIYGRNMNTGFISAWIKMLKL